tara:strand:- start:16 stop:270 length:255 start_codon:yes stop_codon:yes gene_type:complete
MDCQGSLERQNIAITQRAMIPSVRTIAADRSIGARFYGVVGLLISGENPESIEIPRFNILGTVRNCSNNVAPVKGGLATPDLLR